ncbi:hypothetical protein DM02DRAFT_649629 [Periconia macrospinosa]|uniref:Uncharacterized protein n=1 Tax=Periconia macrospinosa TaxID=97972 RepID=A0A2V1EB89_9PLEO|nr:hypothetical protein DM02DRAFT_649629 [Periconia macrospinosa]
MFSEQDIQEIFEEIPPMTDEKKTRMLPELVLTYSGGGFVTAEHLLHSFDALVTKEKNRMSFMTVVHELDVDKDVIFRLVQTSPQSALLSEDQSMIITTEESRSMLNDLYELLKRQVLSKSTYSKEHDVSQASIDALILSPDFDESIYEAGGYLISRNYEESLSKVLKEKIEIAMKELKLLNISSSWLTGEPPLWFIRRIFNSVIDAQGWSSEIIFKEEAESIQCTPKGSIVEESKKTISELEAGTLPYIDKRVFADRFDAVYTSSGEVDELFAALPFVHTTGPFAISKTYLSSRVTQDLPSLEKGDGYLDIGSEWFRGELSQTTAEDVAKALAEQAIRGTSPLPANIHQVGSILFASSSYDRDVETLLNSAKQLATDHASKETPVKDLKFQLADVIHTIPPVAQKVVAKDGAFEKSLVERFWSAFSEAESQKESEFAAFWIKRVVSRQRNYCEALDAIEDAKFRDQLADLLSTYIRKELIPDSLTKARTQGLVRSSKTVKNVQRLETSLSSDKKDLASILSSIDKFEKKQEIHGTEPASTEEAKKVLVGDMVRRMQKPKTDGPLLFLTLVVVLTAKHYPGVVYATGKFAPKLLKQLKSKVSGEDYEQLERWKEMAKSGTLGADDQKLMSHMAEQA